MNHLLRGRAPISDAGWEAIDDEARERLVPALTARPLVDFSGPHGWEHSATNLGRVTPATGPDGVSGLARRVLALVEARVDFALSRAELRDGDRGADDVDYGPLDDAAHRLAVAENAAIFGGWPGAFAGIIESSPFDPVELGDSAGTFTHAVAGAVAALKDAGVGGPYAFALAPDQYQRAVAVSEHGGYPLIKHLDEILDGPIVRVPGLTGAVLLSRRGGDYVLDVGQDISVGYESHDDEVVHLYLEESFSFHVATPEAAVVLTA